MLPTLPTISPKLEELCLEITRRSAALGKGIPLLVTGAISEFMLPVMSYYTNAMEGNPSKLTDIENALNKKISNDAHKRNYQLEHVAHIETQKAVHKRLFAEPDLDVTSVAFLRWLHGEFYGRLPAEFHFAQMVNGDRAAFLPGELRRNGAVVGRHIAPENPEEIERCLRDFNRAYEPSSLKAIERLVALAASHHRLLWIHPFADGNGRVARLFTEAYAFRIDLNRDHLWTVTRAFARDRAEYDKNLDMADEGRNHDYDGRGPLSERGLAAFCEYFLASCLDQIAYMESVLELTDLRQRFERFLTIVTGEKKISKNAAHVLRTIITAGEVRRHDVPRLCDVKERRASQIISEIIASQMAASDTAYGPLRLHITTDMSAVLFPRLT